MTILEWPPHLTLSSITVYKTRRILWKNLYCSELVYYALQAVNIEVTKTSKILDHEIITPTDIGIFLESLPNTEHSYLLSKQNNCIENNTK